MELIGQGVVLMLAGMGIVYLFLVILIIVADCASRLVSRFDGILPQDTPKKAPKKVVGEEDANIALAIAVAMR